MALYFLILTSF